MHPPPYYALREMLETLSEPNRTSALRLYDENAERLAFARGSTHNHQAWEGGWHDHTQDGMNYGIGIYRFLESTGRPMPFALEDPLLCFFLHDIEKPWRFDRLPDGGWRNVPGMATKKERHAFRVALIGRYGFRLSDEHWNAVAYAEGEGDDYRSDMRVAGQLAGLVHAMDFLSARFSPEFPVRNDPWAGAKGRIRP
ncbi:MAG TPA: hypothetical protein VJ694_01565 [Patescibacteria group bacterium]|nr:hypothetical protein [Patescibacteria group bacterium]